MRRPRRGFTLVEMLVVLAMLGGLAALLVPLTVHGRRVARRTACAQNLRHIGIAFTGFKVGAHAKGNVALIESGWEVALLPYLDDCAQALICNEDRSPAFGAIDRAVIAVYSGKRYLYDIEMRERPGWVHKRNESLLGFELWFEDMGPYGDNDFNDLVLGIREKGPTRVEITVLSRSAAYHFDMVKLPERKVLISRLGEGSGVQQWTLACGRASYGMNWLADRLRPGGRQALALDYEKTVVQAGGVAPDQWSDWRERDGSYEFGRHGGYCNVLFADGSVSAFRPDDLDPSKPGNLEAYWTP